MWKSPDAHGPRHAPGGRTARPSMHGCRTADGTLLRALVLGLLTTLGLSACGTGTAPTAAPAETPAAAAKHATTESAALPEAPFGLGRPATAAEIAAWDIDIKPNGEGLPDGAGTAAEGERLFARRCAICHGDFGEGAGRWPVLAGGEDSLRSDDPVKTIGSYWPHLSTVFDYLYRAMPFGHAQSLTPDELYAVVAYLLDLNYLLEDTDMVLDRDSFARISMPNAGGFIADARPDTPGESERAPCMRDCKAEVSITMRARVLDVTPDE